MDSTLLQLGTLVVIVATFVLNLLFAVGVNEDAYKLRDEGSMTQIVSQPTWVLATLVVGVFVAALYWLIHRSTLSRLELRHNEEAPPG